VNTLAIVLCCLTAAPSQSADVPFQIWPDAIGEEVRKNVNCSARPLGYTAQEMASFPGYTHRLGYVRQLFADATQVPHETNRLARRMLDSSFDRAVYQAMGLLGSKISLESAADKAAVTINPADEKSKAAWEALPEQVRGAIEQVVRGAQGAVPHIHQAFDWTTIDRLSGGAQAVNLRTPAMYHYVADPWLGYNSYGSTSFAALASFKSTPLGNAAAAVFAALPQACDDLVAASQDGAIPQFDSLLLKTSAGRVRVLGPGPNRHEGGEAIIIDLGGDDHYAGHLAVPASKSVPVSLVIDVAGNDTYDGRGAATIACGLLGIGALFDLGGNDQYTCGDSGLGCAWHGVGLLVDRTGNDTYRGRQWCQGAAHAGVGMLIDEAGDDQYFCQLESQGLGSTLGIGVLLDKSGKDRYHAYDNENGRRITFPSSQTKSHETSLSQGCGYGRRADGQDGRSLAGGVGALFDGAGDDSYYGGVFSQATGFWWAIGMLVDFGGHDTYRGVYFAQGSAAHFALGSFVDHAGNDRYNDARVLGLALGAGRDGSIGTFVDCAGQDDYYIPKTSAGGGNLNSIGLFCDWQGSDEYHPLTHTYMGAASAANPRSEPFRTRMPTIGAFVDLSGDDRYPSGHAPRNNTKWHHQASGSEWGFGWDSGSQQKHKD